MHYLIPLYNQVMLINAVKDVTSALGDLMQATKSASGKNMQHPAMHQLKDTAKVGRDSEGKKQTTFEEEKMAIATEFHKGINTFLKNEGNA